MAFSLPFLKRKPEKTYYFGLYVTDSYLEGFVIDINQGKPIIIAQKKRLLSVAFDQILEDTDGLISDLELSSHIQLDKTIFFLNSYMIDQRTHEIKDSYKDIIKILVRDLELEPLGYIDVQEAIHDYVQNKSIINGIFVELNKKEVGIFIYKGGSLTHSEYTTRGEDIGESLEEVLAGIPGTHILPSKLYLYGSSTPEVASDIAKYKWKEKTFIQHPSIHQLKDEELNDLLSDSFSKEVLDTEANKDPVEASESTASESEEQNFGFVFGEDIAPRSQHERELAESVSTGREKRNSSASGVFTSIGTWLYQIFGSRSFAKNAKGSKYVILGVGILVVFGAAFIAYEFFFHKATVTVALESKEAENEVELQLAVSEAASKDLALMKHVKVVDYSQEKNTTGKREVGEKAKGEVVIHNFDNAERTIDRGTKITYKDLVLTLDSEAKVASSSGISSDGTKQSGKTKVSVTASEIGESYNVDKGTQFKVADLADSLFVAIADEKFTGGTKKEVKTVAKDDMDALVESAEKEAEKKSAQILKKEISQGEILIPALSEVTLSETTYSKELGEEAEKVKLNASAAVEYFTLDRELLEAEITSELKKDDDSGYLLDSKTLAFEIKDAEIDKKEAIIGLNAKASLYKKVDITDIKKELRFASSDEIAQKLKDSYNAEDATIDKNTALPFLNSWLPLFSRNITIITASS
jgi:hypothetical protein